MPNGACLGAASSAAVLVNNEWKQYDSPSQLYKSTMGNILTGFD